MADGSKVLEIVIQARDEATRVIKGIGDQFSDLSNRATVGAGVISAGLALAAKGAVQLGADMQSARVSFETFLGSGEKAGRLMAQLSDFAVKTPFDLPQVVDGTKRLLAYGVAAEDIIPTFKTLGDLSSGNKVRLDQLTLAYGQVKAATKLTGAELRQFTEAGVPMLEALAEELNKNGGALKTFGGAAKGTGGKVDALTLSLAKQNNRMAEMTEKGKTGSAAYKNLALDIENNKKKLQGLTATTATYTKKVKVSAADVKEMISDGAISFEQTDAALKRLNSEGGRFFENMEQQSKTFNGVMSNTRDEFARFAIGVLGFTKEGDIRQGSIFYYLQMGAEKMLTTLQTVRPIAQKFVDDLLVNMPAVVAIFGALAGLMTPLVIAFVGMIAPALAFMAAGAALAVVIWALVDGVREGDPLIIGLAASFATMAVIILSSVVPAFIAWASAAVTAATATIIALGPVLIIIAAVGAAVGLLALAWKNNWGDIQGKTKAVIEYLQGPGLSNLRGWMEVVKQIIQNVKATWNAAFEAMENAVNKVRDAINGAIDAFKRLAGAKASSGGASFQHGGFVPGSFSTPVPAILHGGERVVPRIGTDVNAGTTGGGGGVTLNFTGPVSLDSEERVQQLADRIISILGRQNELAARGLSI